MIFVIFFSKNQHFDEIWYQKQILWLISLPKMYTLSLIYVMVTNSEVRFQGWHPALKLETLSGQPHWGHQSPIGDLAHCPLLFGVGRGRTIQNTICFSAVGPRGRRLTSNQVSRLQHTKSYFCNRLLYWTTCLRFSVNLTNCIKIQTDMVWRRFK